MVTMMPRVSVRVPLPPGSWHGHASETVWAESRDGARFRILNSPFYAKGLSLEDIVVAKLTSGGYVFERVVARGGHSTYRIILGSDVEEHASELAPLTELGCTWEQGPGRLLAVDVPASADINKVYAALEMGVASGFWDFDEGHVGHDLATAPASSRSRGDQPPPTAANEA